MSVCELDTIRLRGPVRDAAAITGLSSYRVKRELARAGGREPVDVRPVEGFDTLSSGARVGVDVRNRGRAEGWVEFSAPKVATGSNVVALPLADALAVAREVYAEADRMALRWAAPFEDMRVVRVDVDRDVEGVDQQPALLRALARLRAPYHPKTRLDEDPEHPGALSLRRGPSGRWQATLYDKQGEAAHRARYAGAEKKAAALRDVELAAGRLRYEARLRPEVMGQEGLRLVRDLDTERLASLARRYFDRVGYGLEVTGMNRAVAAVMARDDLRADQQFALIGWLVCEGQGRPPMVHRNTVSKYRRLSRDVGVGACDLLELAASASVRIDYDTRRLVAA